MGGPTRVNLASSCMFLSLKCRCVRIDSQGSGRCTIKLPFPQSVVFIDRFTRVNHLNESLSRVAFTYTRQKTVQGPLRTSWFFFQYSTPFGVLRVRKSMNNARPETERFARSYGLFSSQIKQNHTKPESVGGFLREEMY